MTQSSVRLRGKLAACLCAAALGTGTAALAAGGGESGAATVPTSTPSTSTTFTTAPTTTAPPGTGAITDYVEVPPETAPKVALRLPRSGLRVSRRGIVTVPVACPAGSGSACVGTLVLEYRLPATRRAQAARRGRRLRAGRAQFKAKPGKTVKVKLRLSRRSRRLIKRRKRVRMRLTATTRRNGKRTTVSRPVTVKISRRGRRLKR